MDLDLAFVASLKSVEDVHAALTRGIEPDARTGKERTKGAAPVLLNEGADRAYGFVVEYVREHAGMPTPDMVFGKTGVKLEPVPGVAGFYLDEVLNRRLHGTISRQVDEIIVNLNLRKPKEALQAYEAGLRSLRDHGIGHSRTETLTSMGPEFMEYYDKLKSGFRGIQTPWKTVNDATMGFWPEDFVLYVARMGVGKTWLLILLANYAWHVEKKKVLFATTEMSKIKIYQRWAAAHFKLPYNDLRKGQLPIFQEEKLREGVAGLVNAEGLNIVGGDFDFRIESLEAAIQECEPDILFVDGAYLLRVSGDGRTEKAANTFDELKRVAKRNHIPLVASTQFNREVKANNAASVSAEKIAMSDAAGWNADLIFGLVQTEDMKRDRRMLQKPLKFREGTSEDVECWWDFDQMMFDQVGGGSGGDPFSSGGGGGGGTAPKPDNDEFSTGVLDYADMTEEDAPF